jgi:hypothetical protein
MFRFEQVPECAAEIELMPISASVSDQARHRLVRAERERLAN